MRAWLIGIQKGSWSWLYTLLRISLALFFCRLLWMEWQDGGKENWLNLFAHQPSWGLIGITFILSFLNWGFEARKWQGLVSTAEPVTYAVALRATLAGLIPGFFTPNRIGEYGGRLMFIKPIHRKKAFIPTLTGSFSQLLVTLVFGSISCWLIAGHAGMLKGNWYYAVGFMAMLLAFVLVLLYMNLGALQPFIIGKRQWLGKFPDKMALLKALRWSFLRYTIFTVQYLLLLAAFHISLPLEWALPATATLFFIQTAVPSVTLLELGLRGKSTLVVIGLFSADQSGIILSAFLIWLINLVIPAILGIPSLIKSTRHDSR